MRNLSVTLRMILDDMVCRKKLMTRSFWVNSLSFKIYSANPLRKSLDGETLLVAILHNVRSGEVVYDVGSNVGVYSISIAKHQPLASIFSFEPNPETFLKLKANLELNKEFSCNIKPLQIALGKNNCVNNLILSSDHGQSSFFKYNATYRNARIKRIVQVEVKKMDSLVAERQLPPPNHIKIDTEGAEHLIIEGGLSTIIKYLPLLYVEVHESGTRTLNDAKIREILEPIGYRIVQEKNSLICYPPNRI